MFIGAEVDHWLVKALKVLVLALSLPPLTSSEPSGRLAVPVQNMSWPVSSTRRSVTSPVSGSHWVV